MFRACDKHPWCIRWFNSTTVMFSQSSDCVRCVDFQISSLMLVTFSFPSTGPSVRPSVGCCDSSFSWDGEVWKSSNQFSASALSIFMFCSNRHVHYTSRIKYKRVFSLCRQIFNLTSSEPAITQRTVSHRDDHYVLVKYNAAIDTCRHLVLIQKELFVRAFWFCRQKADQ